MPNDSLTLCMKFPESGNFELEIAIMVNSGKTLCLNQIGWSGMRPLEVNFVPVGQSGPYVKN